ncbi:fused response regulator/phosphatase [Geotoga petraea]|jgi:sigma-B regulation protein RsbU (phosphoserine phosphatase)|uniref:Response regulator receiver domain-containing protein n=1 Tax=Geotoga petraea TaxID=28234 RepID=A0A1G6NMA3_9BACT|nr:fused response regulator/phosphatase [Geotoga petraea]MDK2945965.1 phosphoserine phosphatase RsbU/P [Geotoga sp.]SDC68858.1 Response regulator receiver domain-containing protein [Geotoga petraea]
MKNKEEDHYKVLVIDDSYINRVFIKKLINTFLPNYHYIEADLGLLGIEKAKQEKPDVILLDIMMPDLNGYEVCKKIKSEEELKEIPILFISALNDIEDKTKGFEVGGVDYITKPAHSKEIIARIKTHSKLYRIQRDLKEYVNKVDRDLKMAQKFQREMLPTKETFDGLNIKWDFQPSFNVSGDIFGIIEKKDETFVYIVDVSGHGAASAMLSLIIKREIESVIVDKGNSDLREILFQLDDKEKSLFSDGVYFTAAIVKLEDDKITICNAGHISPIIYKNGEIETFKNNNFPLGMGLIDKKEKIILDETSFNKNDIFVMFTDGLVEAENKEGKQFGDQTIRNILREGDFEDITDIIEKIKKEFSDFLNEEKPEDDITLLVGKKVK